MHATKWARDLDSTSGSWSPKFLSQNSFYALGDCGPTFLLYLFFLPKHIADPMWLALSATTTKCRLQGLAMSRKHRPLNSSHSISQIMQKARQLSCLIKASLTITSLIKALGFKTSSIDQKPIT